MPGTIQDNANNKNDQIPLSSYSSLDPRQSAIYNKLFANSELLAKIYLGGLKIYLDGNNPDHLALAAHSFRELMEKFPSYVNINTRPSASLGCKVAELKKTWHTAQNSSCFNNGLWGGNIDKKLKVLLKHLTDFFLWHDEDMPTKSNRIIHVFRKLDPSNRTVPNFLEKKNAEIWQDIYEFFAGVAHHGKIITPNEFNDYIYALELFLIERMYPRRFEDFNQIDQILGGS